MKRRRQNVRRSPFESLIRGVQADDRLMAWYERAVWSFHRAPIPVYADPDAQEAAGARAFEWFVFDLALPDSQRTPAEDWIALESQRQRWSAAVTERYLRFTRDEYGLFEMIAGPLPVYVLREVDTNRVVHAVTMDGSLIAEVGELVAARLFPAEDAAAGRREPPIVELSPGSSVLPRATSSVLLTAFEHGALGVEALYGAGPEWMAEAIVAGEIGRLADAFLDIASDGGVDALDLQEELRELDDPENLIWALAREIVPLTSEEPALLGALVTNLWILARQKAGTSEKTIRKLAKAWQQKMTASAPPPPPAQPSLITLAEDPMWQLSEHEIARLRSIPLAANVQWIGRRRQVQVPIHEEGTLPEYPHAILWYEEPSDLMVGATIVPPRESPSAMLRTLVEAIAQKKGGTGEPRRPALIFVQSPALAARLAPALAPLQIEVQVRYLEPRVGELFAALEEDTNRDLEAGDENVLPFESRYLRLPGSTPQRAERFFTAAAGFYRAAPWKLVAGDVWIDLEFPVTRSATGTAISQALAVVLGNAGQPFGLALYFNPSDLVSVHMGVDSDRGLHFNAMSVIFANDAGTDPGIVAEAREQKWPVADRRFPTAIRTSPDAPARLVAGTELDLAAAALDAVREFVARHGSVIRSDAGKPCRETIAVAGFGRVRASFEPPPPGEPPF